MISFIKEPEVIAYVVKLKEMFGMPVTLRSGLPDGPDEPISTSIAESIDDECERVAEQRKYL